MTCRGAFFIFAVTLSAMAQGSCGDGASSCTPGASIACACTDGHMGAQECGSDGTFGMCTCDPGPLDSGAPLQDGSGPRDAGPLADTGMSVDARAPGDSGVPPAVDIVAIDLGEETTCVAKRDGSAWCWGRGLSPSPTLLAGATAVVDVGPGYNHYCIVEATGGVGCMGDNSQNQLGHGSDVPSSPTLVSAVGLSDATTVTGGHSHTCALRRSGAVSCWGDRGRGQAGNRIDSGSFSTNQRIPVDMAGIATATQVEAGGNHTCALLSAGSVACWGGNYEYQLGNGTSTDSAAAVPVIGLTDAIHIAASASHNCAAKGDGSVVCWGRGVGLLTPVVGVDDAVEAASGEASACARSATGAVSCWGGNFFGQLGDGTSTDSPTPVAVSGLVDAVLIASGARHACAVRATGQVVCWGDNSEGQVGDGSTLTRRVPTAVVFP